MHKRLNKIAYFIITVLCSALVSRYVFKYAVEFKENLSPMLKVLIGMAVIVVSFIPLSYFSKPIEKMTKKYLEQSKKVTEKKNAGILWGLLVVGCC